MPSNSNLFFENWMRQTFLGDSTLVGLVGTDSAGQPSIFAYHFQSVDERAPFPRLTMATFGTPSSGGKFQEFPFLALQMEAKRFAVCAWSTESVDEADAVFSRANVLIQGPTRPQPATTDFGSYRIDRTLYRNDLFDNSTKAYHVHGEFRIWVHKGVLSIT